MKILPNVLGRQFFRYQAEYEQKALDVLRSGRYILGGEVSSFETEFAAYTGSDYCVGLASGLDALWLSLRILGIGEGDEVIIQGNAYIACVMGITINGAVPVFVEPDRYHNLDPGLIEAKISEKTKAVMVVHLYGLAAEMTKIKDICDRYGLYLIEDCAQSHGATHDGKMTGAFGDIGCFSFYPSKNLGCFGDGGAIVTQNEEIAKQFRIYRNYGSEKRYYNKVVGTNSRLDEIQAGLLRVKLSHLDEYNHERRVICGRYLEKIQNPLIELPGIPPGSTTVWHQFVIRSEYRDQLQEHLLKYDIQTLIHYPIPPHLSEAYSCLNIAPGSLPVTERYAREVLSLPLYNGMTREEVDYVIQAVNCFGGETDEAEKP